MEDNIYKRFDSKESAQKIIDDNNLIGLSATWTTPHYSKAVYGIEKLPAGFYLINSSRKPITIEDKTFYEKMKNLFIRATTEESGSMQYGNGSKRKPLKALDELQDALFDVTGQRTEQEDIYSQERAKRFKSVEEVNIVLVLL